MKNQDKLFNKIKYAAENAENQDFPSMEKIWSRIDAKLDTKVEKKTATNWRKLLVAASILGVVFIGYQFFKDNNNTTIIIEKTIVKSDSKKTSNPVTEPDSNAIAKTNPIIKKDIDKLIEKQISNPNSVASIEEPKSDLIAKENRSGDVNDEKSDDYKNETIKLKMADKNIPWKSQNINPAVGVKYYESSADKVAITKDPIAKLKKQKPLVIVDNELQKDGYSSLNEDEIESLIELPEPVYFINGIEFSEESLFGDTPTSPYAPLNKQNIISISVLQPDKAIPIYGKKGEKGIVIITTKDGKPKAKK